MDFQSRRLARNAACLLAATSLLSACLVLPVDSQRYPLNPAPAPVVVQAALGPQLLNVRLYPLNAEATQAGALSAVVMDSLNGRGSFTMAYQGRNLSGEATRVGPDYPGFGAVLGAVLGESHTRTSGRRGIANAAGPGLNAQCEYVLTANSQGVGACQFSDGARYQMHFGQ
ncbi:MAG: hypothetical protein ACK5O3_16880 [Burkholderiales bacterium]|jgi:hypothetical protein